MFNEINLEVSMKVFKQTTPGYIRDVIRKIFDQWADMLVGREKISVLLWASDGSEILDFTGALGKEIEWAYFAGCANKPTVTGQDGLDVNLHEKNVKYIDNPPKVTYRTIKAIAAQIKKEGRARHPGTQIRVGVPFDIGPEFARSDFKYNRHREICTGEGEGGKTFINSYGLLAKDDYPYAGFPEGIAEGTPFGTFLGRQVQIYLGQMGLDYLWLSNGVGFSATSWNATGEVFDGKKFDTGKFGQVQEKIFGFWENFRRECPDYPVYTRGTNFSADIDYATDAVGLHRIYHANLNIVPPPNSPWAAINGNYGLELMGHLTRCCELPGQDFMFRFYLHDCWWVNSPWYDRYNQSPHDIYLPMALSRIDENGITRAAGITNIFTLDNTFGDMPDNCVREVIPHLLTAEKDSADAPAPFVWVYPLREYTTETGEENLRKILSGDLFICRAISNGFPLSSVVSCDNFIGHDKTIYAKSILVTPVPERGSAFETEILRYAERGGKVLFYGTITHASEEFLTMFDITLLPLEHDIRINAHCPDENGDAAEPQSMIVRKEICGQAIPADDKIVSQYKNAVWYLAPPELQSLDYDTNSVRDIDPPQSTLWGTVYLREVLKRFGYDISFSKPTAQSKLPIIITNRCNHADIFSVYTPDQTVETRLLFPLGAPVLDGYEIELKNGAATYRFPKCIHKECRVYVVQESGVVSVKEMPPVSMQYRRRIEVSGLKNATVRLFAEDYCKADFCVRANAAVDRYEGTGQFDGALIHSEEYGTYYEVRNITGNIVFSMPYKKK